MDWSFLLDLLMCLFHLSSTVPGFVRKIQNETKITWRRGHLSPQVLQAPLFINLHRTNSPPVRNLPKDWVGVQTTDTLTGIDLKLSERWLRVLEKETFAEPWLSSCS